MYIFYKYLQSVIVVIIDVLLWLFE